MQIVWQTGYNQLIRWKSRGAGGSVSFVNNLNVNGQVAYYIFLNGLN